MGPTKTPGSVRKVSLLYPVTEDRPDWSPKAAGIGTRHVLDGLRVLLLTAPDPEARLWPITSSRFLSLWERTCKHAGVRYRKPHTLRHSFASILLSRNAPILAVQKAGGWSTAITLLGTYARWVQDDLASTAASSEVTAEFPKQAGLLL